MIRQSWTTVCTSSCMTSGFRVVNNRVGHVWVPSRTFHCSALVAWHSSPKLADGESRREYGYDVTAWPGFAVLREMRDLHTLGSYIRLADVDNEHAATELHFRLDTLKQGTQTPGGTPDK